jgi:hypothetical protein
VKSVVTSLAFQVGHLMGLDAEDRVANRTWLHAIKFFVNILFPYKQRIENAAILVVEHEHNL